MSLVLNNMENILLVRNYYTEYNIIMGQIHNKLLQDYGVFKKGMGKEKS